MQIQLHPRQMQALMSPAREILYGGAMAGGKSHLLRVASIVYSMWIPGCISYIFRRTFKELMANHIHTPGGYLQLLSEFIEDGIVKWNKSDYAFDWINGSRIQLAHAQYESDIDSYQGAQFQFLGIDEATHFSEKMYRFLRSRNRLGSLKVPDQYKHMFPRIMNCSNPGGIGHNFFKGQFVDHGGEVWRAPPHEGGMTRQYIQAKLSDNPTMTENDPFYRDKLLGIGDPNVVQAMLEGDWSVVFGGMFDDVWDGSVHILQPFDIPAGWTIDRGFDWGSSAPAACLWFAESDGSPLIQWVRSGNAWEEIQVTYPKGSIFVIRELYFADAKYQGLRLTNDEMGMRIRDVEDGEEWGPRVQPGPADSAIFDRIPGKNSIASEMAAHGARFIRADKSPGSRIRGWQILRGLFRNMKNHPHQDRVIGVFNTCPNVIRTVPTLPRDRANLDDVDTLAEDHLAEVMRYRVLDTIRSVSETTIVGA